MASTATDSSTLVIHNATVVDGTDADPLTRGVVVVEGNKIAAVGAGVGGAGATRRPLVRRGRLHGHPGPAQPARSHRAQGAAGPLDRARRSARRASSPSASRTSSWCCARPTVCWPSSAPASRRSATSGCRATPLSRSSAASTPGWCRGRAWSSPSTRSRSPAATPTSGRARPMARTTCAGRSASRSGPALTASS